MKIVNFNNAINYNEYSITDYNPYQTVNISSLLYSSDLKLPIKTLSSTFFHLKNILYTGYVITEEVNNKYVTVVYPAIAELLEKFNFITNEPIISDTPEEAKQAEINLKLKIQDLFETIKRFIASRELLFSRDSLPAFGYTSEDEQKILELIMLVNSSFLDIKEYFDDFFHYSTGDTEKTEYVLSLNYLYNYKTLKDFFKNLALKNTEYYTFDKEKATVDYRRDKLEMLPFSDITDEEEIALLEKKSKKFKELTTFINNEPFFTREFFATFSLKLEELIEKENAIDKFVETILNINEEKQNIIIKDDLTIKNTKVIEYGKSTEVL